MGRKRHNHADKNINKSGMKYEIERKGGSGTQPLESNAQNITTYELLPDLHRDPFVVGNYIP